MKSYKIISWKSHLHAYKCFPILHTTLRNHNPHEQQRRSPWIGLAPGFNIITWKLVRHNMSLHHENNTNYKNKNDWAKVVKLNELKIKLNNNKRKEV